jgi:O-antigen/teichoic acid export membrane protein
MAESRVKKSLLNARVNLIFYFLSLILSFFSRKLFLDTLGADFLGLTGTLYNLLGFLNLAELGIGSAIGYVLYKPLFEKDETKISEIISVFGYLYRWIGLIILGAGCLLACFLPLIFPSTGFQFGIIYFAYFSFLASSLIGYFANYKQTLLGADQRNYVVTAYFQTATIIKTLIQMACAYYTGNYYLWVVIELIFGGVYSVILNWKVNQVYPWLKSEVKQGKELFRKYPEVMKYTKQLFVHKIGGFVQWQTVPFLTYLFTSLRMVAYYGNYAMIVDKVYILFNNFLGSTSAGVGNLIAEGNKEKIKAVFWELLGIRFLVAGIICTSLLFLMEPFISLWLGSEYILPRQILMIILINILATFICGEATGQFIHGYGLFWDIGAPIAELCIFLLVAIIGGYLYGLAGVLSGSFVSLFIIKGIWKPYFLYHWGFQENVLYYWLNWIKYLVLILLPAIVCYFLIPIITNINPAVSYFEWIKYAVLIDSIYLISTYLLLYLFAPEIRTFTNRITAKFFKR